HRGGLPGAVRAQQPDDGAVSDLEVDAGHCLHRLVAGAEGLDQALGDDRIHILLLTIAQADVDTAERRCPHLPGWNVVDHGARAAVASSRSISPAARLRNTSPRSTYLRRVSA